MNAPGHTPEQYVGTDVCYSSCGNEVLCTVVSEFLHETTCLTAILLRTTTNHDNYLLSAISHQQLEVYDTHDTTQTRLSSATIELSGTQIRRRPLSPLLLQCLESRVLEVNSRRGQPSQLKRFVSYDSAVRNYFIGVPRLAPIDYETLLLVNPTLASRVIVCQVFKRR